MKKLPLALAAAALLFASACSNTQLENAGWKQIGGTMIGGALGGLGGAQIGSGSGQLAATAAGALLGAFVGSEIGASLDKADRLYAAQAQNQAQTTPIGQTVSWSNAESGNSGSVTATREGVNNRTGSYCREFRHKIIIAGKTEQAYGTACRQPDGSWQIM